MPADEVVRNRVDALELGHGLAHQGRALPIRTWEALVSAAAHVVYICIVKLRLVAQARWRLSIDPQQDVIARDVGPSSGQRGHIGSAVHVGTVEDHDRRPLFGRAGLVALGGPDGVGQEGLGRAVEDLSGGQRNVPDVFLGAPAFPAEPLCKAVGIARAGKRLAVGGEVKPTVAAPESLKAEIQAASGGVAVDRRAASQCQPALDLLTVLRKFHQPEVRQPQAG